MYSIRAVSLIFGVSFESRGPGASKEAIVCPEMPRAGSSATAKTNIPIPPNQWVKLLQKSVDLGKISTLSIILKPVVEKPLQVSKKASTG